LIYLINIRKISPKERCLKIVDLHVHSNYSDGLFGPEKIVELATGKNLGGFALTDHDSLDGISETIALIKKKELPLLFIAGCEFSTYMEGPGEIHLLGYFPGYAFRGMESLLSVYRKSRVKRAARINGCLKKCGIELPFEDLLTRSGETIGRMHIAREMVRLGYIESPHEAFDRYLGRGRSCYIPRTDIKTCDVIGSIKENNGKAVLAHPFFLKTSGNWNYLVKMISAGLDGIEFSHPKISPALSLKIREAYSNDLILTAGSDFHGDENNEGVGSYGIGIETAGKYFPGFGVFPD
jgi:hypothetical protein